MIYTLKTPQPHSKQQRALMLAHSTPQLVEMWMASGTKFGKTVGAASGLIGKAWVRNNSLYRWVAPIYSQAKIGFKLAHKIIPREAPIKVGEQSKISDINKSDLFIDFTQNQTTIEFKSGKYPEDLEGEACNGYIIDEAAKCSESVYDSAKTTVTVTRGPIVCISTPKGKNWFYNKCMQAKDEMEWALKNNKIPKKIFLTAPSSVNPAVTQEAIDEAKRSLPDRLFQQYFLAEFVDDGTVFIGFRDCMEGMPVAQGSVWFASDVKSLEVVIGVDWAKTTDYTVFGAFAIGDGIPRFVGYQRFQGMNYLEQVKELYRFQKKFKQTHVIRHDKTGIGNVIDDLLNNTDMPCEGRVFTNDWKESAVTSLMLAFEKRERKLPYWQEMINELEMYEVTPTSSGRLRYAAPLGFHDDIVSMLLLANEAVNDYHNTSVEVKFLEDLPKTEESVETWYNELIEEDNDSPF